MLRSTPITPGPVDDLERRLAVIEDPSYEDPARRDLTAVDYFVLAVLNISVISAMLVYAWGWPW